MTRCRDESTVDTSGSIHSDHESHDQEEWTKRLLRWLITMPLAPDDNQNEEEEKRVRHKRNYQVWGSEKQFFLFGGRLRVVKAGPMSIATFMAILLPAILFAIFDASWCWHNIHPSAVIIFYYCWLIGLSSFIKASTSDPGVIPRNIHITDDPYDLPEDYFNTISLPSGPEGDLKVDVRYCQTCHNWRMPRTFHCAKCDSCISIHDHHCKWLNNCVGERNYRFFFVFLLFSVIFCFYGGAMCYYRILQHDQHVRHIPMTVFNIVYLHMAMLYPLLLLIYHIYLCCRGETTREYLRSFKSKQIKTYPFSLNSIIKNFVYGVGKPRGWSYVRPRDKYNRGDMRFTRFTSGKL